jgi:hypothetical protein
MQDPAGWRQFAASVIPTTLSGRLAVERNKYLVLPAFERREARLAEPVSTR